MYKNYHDRGTEGIVRCMREQEKYSGFDSKGKMQNIIKIICQIISIFFRTVILITNSIIMQQKEKNICDSFQ